MIDAIYFKVGILITIKFFFSNIIFAQAISISLVAYSQCELFFEKHLLVLACFLVTVDYAGIICACRGLSWLVRLYFLLAAPLMVALICLSVVGFMFNQNGAVEVVRNDKGHREYRLGNYSNWLQKRVIDDQNWIRIKRCMIDREVCGSLLIDDAVWSSCCKPAEDCNFSNVTQTNNRKVPTAGDAAAFTNNSEPCNAWDNHPNNLCLNCGSCKAASLYSRQVVWRWVASINTVSVFFMIVTYFFIIQKSLQAPGKNLWNPCQIHSV